MKHAQTRSGRQATSRRTMDKRGPNGREAGRGLAATMRPASENRDERDGDETVVVTKFSVLGARVVWFFIGPVALFLTLWIMLTSGRTAFSVHDVFFFSLVMLIMGCRWIEQRSGQASNMEGKPATWKEFRRYAIRFPIVAVILWLMTKLVLMLL